MSQETEYGTTYPAHSPPSARARRLRHIIWGDMHSKCGHDLADRTTDLTLPLCGTCDRAMRRLRRERGHQHLTWS